MDSPRPPYSSSYIICLGLSVSSCVAAMLDLLTDVWSFKAVCSFLVIISVVHYVRNKRVVSM